METSVGQRLGRENEKCLRSVVLGLRLEPAGFIFSSTLHHSLKVWATFLF